MDVFVVYGGVVGGSDGLVIWEVYGDVKFFCGLVICGGCWIM